MCILLLPELRFNPAEFPLSPHQTPWPSGERSRYFCDSASSSSPEFDCPAPVSGEDYRTDSKSAIVPLLLLPRRRRISRRVLLLFLLYWEFTVGRRRLLSHSDAVAERDLKLIHLEIRFGN